MLRHQLAVALRERPRVHSRLPRLEWARLGLLAGTLPADRLAAAAGGDDPADTGHTAHALSDMLRGQQPDMHLLDRATSRRCSQACYRRMIFQRAPRPGLLPR